MWPKLYSNTVVNRAINLLIDWILSRHLCFGISHPLLLIFRFFSFSKFDPAVRKWLKHFTGACISANNLSPKSLGMTSLVSLVSGIPPAFASIEKRLPTASSGKIFPRIKPFRYGRSKRKMLIGTRNFLDKIQCIASHSYQSTMEALLSLVVLCIGLV